MFKALSIWFILSLCLLFSWNNFLSKQFTMLHQIIPVMTFGTAIGLSAIIVAALLVFGKIRI